MMVFVLYVAFFNNAILMQSRDCNFLSPLFENVVYFVYQKVAFLLFFEYKW